MVTVITRTIGPSGRDYASFTLAEADVTNIGTSADLVANDEAIVFEADAGTYSGNVTFSSTLTTDATRNVTYKPAAGSEHGGVRGAGVVISGTSFVAFVQDAWTHLVGLEIYGSSSGGTTRAVELKDEGARGSRLSECILWGGSLATLSTGIGVFLRFQVTGTLPSSEAAVVENCVIWAGTVARAGYYSGQQSAFAVRNCTFAGDGASASTSTGILLTGSTGGATAYVELVNNIGLEGVKPYNDSSTGTITLSGSNNFAENAAGVNFPVAVQGSPYPITATTDTNPGPGDWAIYEAATGRLYDVPDNDVWGQGVGPSSNPDVPTTDIVRALRSGSTANPGAFEAPAVFTTNQSVAPNGRLEADRISHIYPYTYIAQSKTSALSGGETVSYHWYFKVDSTLAAGAGETITFSIKDSGGTVVEEINWAVAYDDATPTVALGSTTTAGSGYTTDALEYVAVSNDWVRCSITLTDFGSTGQDVEVTHTSLTGAASAGTIYDVTLWGSEITTIDRTPTATDLRPISGGIVHYDAYPAEHRSLFASYEDAGDNWYKVTMNLTEPN